MRRGALWGEAGERLLMLAAGFVVRKDGERGVVVTVDGMTNAPHGGAVGQVGSLYHPTLVSWVRLSSY